MNECKDFASHLCIVQCWVRFAYKMVLTSLGHLYGVFSCKFIELKIMAILGDCPVIFGRFFIVLGLICVQKGANFMLAPTAQSLVQVCVQNGGNFTLASIVQCWVRFAYKMVLASLGHLEGEFSCKFIELKIKFRHQYLRY